VGEETRPHRLDLLGGELSDQHPVDAAVRLREGGEPGALDPRQRLVGGALPLERPEHQAVALHLGRRAGPQHAIDEAGRHLFARRLAPFERRGRQGESQQQDGGEGDARSSHGREHSRRPPTAHASADG
jgi:hypothetical protein